MTYSSNRALKRDYYATDFYLPIRPDRCTNDNIKSQNQYHLDIYLHYTEIECPFCVLAIIALGTACADPEGGGQGVRTPPEKSQNIGFVSNTGPDPLKITKLSSQHSRLGHHRHASETPFICHHRHASETPFIWRFAGGPMMALVDLGSSLPSKKKKKKKNIVKVDPLLQNFLDPCMNGYCSSLCFLA